MSGRRIVRERGGRWRREEGIGIGGAVRDEMQSLSVVSTSVPVGCGVSRSMMSLGACLRSEVP